jgi:hypothetical protein
MKTPKIDIQHCVSQVGGDLQLVARIIAYVLNGAVPSTCSNVKRISHF